MVALGESLDAGTNGGDHARPFMAKDDGGSMTPLPLDHVQVAVTDAGRCDGNLNLTLLWRA
jgi:hypothetical protein